jgi:diguanylate cyclase (GGDEF)-like protein
MRFNTRDNVDWCFRYGGDEFAVIIPYASLDQVLQVMNRILERYRETIRIPETSLSVGLARFLRNPAHTWEQDTNDLINRADMALYTGKDQDVNREVMDERSYKKS